MRNELTDFQSCHWRADLEFDPERHVGNIFCDLLAFSSSAVRGEI